MLIIRAKCLVFILFGLFASAAESESFYLAPPPRGFGNVNSIETTTSRRYDSEVESDYLAYSPTSCHFQYVLRKSPNSFCASIGSIGSKRFLTDVNFIFSHSFSDRFTFRFHGVQEQDFSTDTNAQVAEMLYRVNLSQSVGVHGQFDSEKSNDDLGVSYNLHFPEAWMRVELNAYDYSRNKRNESTDRFEKDPYSFTVSFLKSVIDDLYFLNVHIEPDFLWLDSPNNLRIRRSRHWVEGFISHRLGFYSLESRQNLTHINQQYEDEKVIRLQGQKSFALFLVGARGARKSWKTEAGRLVHQDLLPFIWYQPKGQFQSIDLGYELTWHRSYGNEALRSDSDRSSALEHRLNMMWAPFENESGYFKLLFTFDLDRFGTGETWEGGSGQLAFTF